MEVVVETYDYMVEGWCGKGVGETGVSPWRKTGRSPLETERFLRSCAVSDAPPQFDLVMTSIIFLVVGCVVMVNEAFIVVALAPRSLQYSLHAKWG